MVLVCLRIYTFHASLPLSRPPPVSFSPPNAPPISATQKCQYSHWQCRSRYLQKKEIVPLPADLRKIADEKPWGTLLCKSIASSIVLYFNRYKIEVKVSCSTIGKSPLGLRDAWFDIAAAFKTFTIQYPALNYKPATSFLHFVQCR